MANFGPLSPKQRTGSFQGQALQTPNANYTNRTKPVFRRCRLPEPCSESSHSGAPRGPHPHSNTAGPGCTHEKHLLPLSQASALLVGSSTLKIEMSPRSLKTRTPCWQLLKLNFLNLKSIVPFCVPKGASYSKTHCHELLYQQGGECSQAKPAFPSPPQPQSLKHKMLWRPFLLCLRA